MTMPLSGERPMLTSFWPTATSCKTEDSNFKTNLDMGTPSLSRLSFRFFAVVGAFEPAANFGERPRRFRRITQHDDGDVIATAGFVGQIDQTAGGSLRVVGLIQDAGDLRGGEFAEQ